MPVIGFISPEKLTIPTRIRSGSSPDTSALAAPTSAARNRVVEIRREDVVRIGAGHHELEVGIHADQAVAVHVHAAGGLGRARHVDHDDDVELGGLLPLGAGTAADRRLMDLVANRFAGLRILDPYAHTGSCRTGRRCGVGRGSDPGEPDQE